MAGDSFVTETEISAQSRYFQQIQLQKDERPANHILNCVKSMTDIFEQYQMLKSMSQFFAKSRAPVLTQYGESRVNQANNFFSAVQPTGDTLRVTRFGLIRKSFFAAVFLATSAIFFCIQAQIKNLAVRFLWPKMPVCMVHSAARNG